MHAFPVYIKSQSPLRARRECKRYANRLTDINICKDALGLKESLNRGIVNGANCPAFLNAEVSCLRVNDRRSEPGRNLVRADHR